MSMPSVVILSLVSPQISRNLHVHRIASMTVSGNRVVSGTDAEIMIRRTRGGSPAPGIRQPQCTDTGIGVVTVLHRYEDFMGPPGIVSSIGTVTDAHHAALMHVLTIDTTILNTDTLETGMYHAHDPAQAPFHPR